LSCRESAGPWPFASQLAENVRTGDELRVSTGEAKAVFDSARNFFTGEVVASNGKPIKVGAFYSAATLPRPSYTLWLLAGVDGKIHQYDGMSDRPVASAGNWGSDIVAVDGACGRFVMASANADATSADTLRVYEVVDREPAEVGAPLEFAGPVTSLWNSPDRTSATAVVHNLKSGQYEAYILSSGCDR
jgi:hypothetical protein